MRPIKFHRIYNYYILTQILQFIVEWRLYTLQNEQRNISFNMHLQICLVLLILTHINFCGLFNAKCTLYIYTKRNISFNMHLQICLVLLILTHINLCGLFNAKCTLYIYTKYKWFGLVGLNRISNIVGYLMANYLYTYMLNIYKLVLLGFMAYQAL